MKPPRAYAKIMAFHASMPFLGTSSKTWRAAAKSRAREEETGHRYKTMNSLNRFSVLAGSEGRFKFKSLRPQSEAINVCKARNLHIPTVCSACGHVKLMLRQSVKPFGWISGRVQGDTDEKEMVFEPNNSWMRREQPQKLSESWEKMAASFIVYIHGVSRVHGQSAPFLMHLESQWEAHVDLEIASSWELFPCVPRHESYWVVCPSLEARM